MSVDACLAGYGVVVALAAPRLLTWQTATGRAPRLGVAAWLVAASSVVGSWLAAAVSLVLHPGAAARAVGVAIVAGLAARLIWACAATWWATRFRRARHARAAALLGRVDPALGALVVDSPEPAAYCLPRAGGGLVVITTAARSALSSRQLRAVLAHERAHLDGRHHLLLGLAQVLARAMPALRLYRQLGGQLTRLLEMRADDAAARVHGRHTVATAIAAMSAHTSPAGALGAGGPAATVRALRLTRGDRRSLHARLGLAATAIALAAGPYLATLPPCPHPW